MSISNLITGTIASCESYIEGFEPQNVCDGNKNTFWKSEPYFKWLILDLQDTHNVEKIKLILGHNGEYYHYHIETSLDRINWDFVYEKNDDKISTEDGDIVLVNKVARYVKLTVSYCSTCSVVTVENIFVYGNKEKPILNTLSLTNQRTKAINANKIDGFNIVDDVFIENGLSDKVIETNNVGSYFVFDNVDFKDGNFDQLRFLIGFPIKDKTMYSNIEFRLDDINGEKVGNIHLCRQYTYWTELAIEIKKEDGSLVSGVHNLYIIVTQIDAPQSVMFYWFRLCKQTSLSTKVMDYKENLIEDEKQYEVFFGDMHCHTGLTDGFGTAEHAYDYARNVAKMDFLGITEHSNCLDEMFDCEKSFKWRDLRLASEKATEDGKFVGLYGSETTWYNQFGHMNVYCADFYINSYEFKFDDALTYYKKLKEFPGIISQWNHPWSCGQRHLDFFEPYDEELDKITYTIELNNLELSGDDVLKYYTIALDKGWHLSPVGNQDNHKEDWGTQNGMRTAIIARRLTVADIFDAMKNRRTYFTGTPGFRVLYSINNNIQGSIINHSNELNMNVKASCDDKCKMVKIEIYGENGKVIDTINCSNYEIDIDHKITTKQKYYFLKLIREDNQIAVTAPIWVK